MSWASKHGQAQSKKDLEYDLRINQQNVVFFCFPNISL